MSEPDTTSASTENLSSDVTAGPDLSPDELRITEDGIERIFQDDDPEIVNQ